MKDGYGEYKNKQLNIHYRGYWKLGTMWGFGIKEFKEDHDLPELTVYEGWFANGNFHGIGCLNYTEGSYLYGNFRNGKPDSQCQVLNYNSDNDCWYTISTAKGKNQSINEGMGFPPAHLDGSKTEIEKCFIYKKDFEDLYFQDNAKINLANFDPKDIAFYRMSYLYEKGKIFNQNIGYNMFKPGPYANIEFTTCIEALSRHPNLI